MPKTKSLNNKNWIGGIFAAIGASLCCITPFLALIGGASGLSTSFSWIEPYRPYFIGATFLIFLYAWYQKLKIKKEVDCDCVISNNKSFLHTKTFLGIITIIAALFIAFPYYAKLFYPKPKYSTVILTNKNNIQTVQLNISGMDCEGCVAHINDELSKVKGIMEANTSYKKANTIVKFDKSKISVDSITNTISAIGYNVTSITNKK